MFAIPGILGLLIFVYLRPQEAVESLQDIPFLNLFFLLTLFGAAVDLRLRVSKPIAIPNLPWALAFLLWSTISLAISAPDRLMELTLVFGITVIVYVVIAQGIQTFHVFERVGSMIAALAMVLAVIAVHQGLAPFECIELPHVDEHAIDSLGVPDGRPCPLGRAWQCMENDPKPGVDYLCERAGVLGTHTIAGRARYRGILQDPNELAVALSSGFALLLALRIRTKSRFWAVAAVSSLILTAWAMKLSGSRSGQLGFLAVLGVFLLWRYRLKAVAVLGPLALPLMAIIAAGGAGRADADASTEERYTAWREGFYMFRQSPLWGVGQSQYETHHYLTAHNTYMLVLAEGGIVGLYLFSMLLWVSIKIPISALWRFQRHPEARVAEVWSVALLAAMGAILAGSAFLSFAYHFVLWIFLGLAGALFVCVKRHDPAFAVRVGFWDFVGVAVVDVGLYVLLDVFLRLKGF